MKKKRKPNIFIPYNWEPIIVITSELSKLLLKFTCIRKQNVGDEVLVLCRDWASGSNVHAYTEYTLEKSNFSQHKATLYLNNSCSLYKTLTRVGPCMSYKTLVLDVRYLFVSGEKIHLPLIMYETILLAIFLRSSGIMPIVLCPDIEGVSDRLLSGILTASEGFIVSYSQIPKLCRYVTKERALGPYPVISPECFSLPVVPIDARPIDLFLGGSQYGNRNNLYTCIAENLLRKGYKVLVKWKSELSYDEYLETLKNSKLTFVSALKSDAPMLCAMGKVFEAASCGCLPVSHSNPALDSCLIPNLHYLGIDKYASCEDISLKIINILGDAKRLHAMTIESRKHLKEIHAENLCWNDIYRLILEKKKIT